MKKPHLPVSTGTISRWLKEVLTSAGINTQFTAHSTSIQLRRALTSPPEKSVLTSVGGMRMDVFGSRVYYALEKVLHVHLVMCTCQLGGGCACLYLGPQA